jgi:hypothetical protein
MQQESLLPSDELTEEHRGSPSRLMPKTTRRQHASGYNPRPTDCWKNAKWSTR